MLVTGLYPTFPPLTYGRMQPGIATALLTPAIPRCICTYHNMPVPPHMPLPHTPPHTPSPPHTTHCPWVPLWAPACLPTAAMPSYHTFPSGSLITLDWVYSIPCLGFCALPAMPYRCYYHRAYPISPLPATAIAITATHYAIRHAFFCPALLPCM